MQCIIMENTLIKLTLHDETKKRAHDSHLIQASSARPPIQLLLCSATFIGVSCVDLWSVIVAILAILACFLNIRQTHIRT